MHRVCTAQSHVKLNKSWSHAFAITTLPSMPTAPWVGASLQVLQSSYMPIFSHCAHYPQYHGNCVSKIALKESRGSMKSSSSSFCSSSSSGKYKFEEIEDNSMTTGRFNGVGGWKVDVYRGRYWYLRLKYLRLKYLWLKYLLNTIAIFRYWKREHFSAIEHLKKLLVEHHPNEDISVRKFILWNICG